MINDSKLVSGERCGHCLALFTPEEMASRKHFTETLDLELGPVSRWAHQQCWDRAEREKEETMNYKCSHCELTFAPEDERCANCGKKREKKTEAKRAPLPCTMCDKPMTWEEATRSGLSVGNIWLVHEACLKQLDAKPTEKSDLSLDEAVSELMRDDSEREVAANKAKLSQDIKSGKRCTRCGIEFTLSDRAVVEDGNGQLQEFAHKRCHDLEVERIPLASLLSSPDAPARARVERLERELRHSRQEEENARARARGLEQDLKEARQQANTEEHLENARGWARALHQCLDAGKAQCTGADVRGPRGWNHASSESTYRFALSSGEEIELKVKHVPGARPPKKP